LRKTCLRHATQPNGVIDWDAYEAVLLGHMILIDPLSGSSSGNSSDSDCVFLYSTPGSTQGREIYPFTHF